MRRRRKQTSATKSAASSFAGMQSRLDAAMAQVKRLTERPDSPASPALESQRQILEKMKVLVAESESSIEQLLKEQQAARDRLLAELATAARDRAANDDP